MMLNNITALNAEQLEQYKKEHISEILKELNKSLNDSEDVITEKDVNFDEVDDETYN